ncbi:hypothetical protein [Clostridium sp. KNHs214]|uniref:hypothetical protein n=1 Tax=Clostridium sp. KNHs214 TaxID=1540257 RepID=UPI00054D1EBE|nr:hypothetical protein [Clostridium sp. KNHs214]
MQGRFYRGVKEYIEEKGIEIVEKADFHKKRLSAIDEEDVEKQLKLISSFHSKMKKCDEYILERIGNETGKLVESFKIELNNAKKVIEDVQEIECRSNIENIIINQGYHMINMGEKCIQNIYSNGYIDTIVRSMDQVEFCLGDIYFDNLSEKDGKLQIKNIKKISYNTVEMDAFNLLSKLKRKGLIMDWRSLIVSFCYFENLNSNSGEIIRWLMNYPYDFVKYCNLYRKPKKKWNEEKYRKKLIAAIEQAENMV